MHQRGLITKVELKGFPQNKHICDTRTQMKKQNITSIPEASLFPLPANRPQD